MKEAELNKIICYSICSTLCEPSIPCPSEYGCKDFIWMKKRVERHYKNKILKWAKRHYWDSLEKEKNIIILHLKKMFDNSEIILGEE